MTITIDDTRRSGRLALRLITVIALLLFAPVQNIAQQVIDLCGCAGDPTLQPFNAGNPATYPPGTSGCSGPCSSGTIILGLPDDGVLRFSSFTADGSFFIGFSRNPSNTPVTILVSGNILLRGLSCCFSMNVSGNDGSSGTSSTAGVGGTGGNGGFKGGDGAALAINGTSTGGAGLGPAGGAGATATSAAGGGTFLGLPELLPLLGGSGGGGGAGFGSSSNCTGGGGGGGGGGLLLVANGTITLTSFDLHADGGRGGSVGNGSGCAIGGGGGAGGALRVVASRLIDGGTGRLFADGAPSNFNSGGGSSGRIRLESLDASAQTQFFTSPAALRVTGPGPIANPVSPTVRITSVGGQAPPAIPQGGYGAIDVVLSSPGVTGVDIATSGVPSGTTVLVTVKPRIGASPLSATVPLSTCNGAGDCTATTAFTLSAGAYVVEARATFQIQ